MFHVSCFMFLAGCFNEPEPAYRTVPAVNRVYLSDRALKDLSSVEDAFAAGAAIEYVNLDRNELETLPAEIGALTGLKWLRLNSNRLSELPDLSSLKSLRRVYLRGNRFTAVPETLSRLPALTDIDISENPVGEIPEWLARREGLESLSFSRTAVRKLPEDLSAWKSLKSLQLGDLALEPAEMARVRAALPKTAVVF